MFTVALIKKVYKKLASANPNIYLFTYYDSVDFLKELYDLPLKAPGLDFVHNKDNFGQNPEVRERVKNLKDDDFVKPFPL